MGRGDCSDLRTLGLTAVVALVLIVLVPTSAGPAVPGFVAAFNEGVGLETAAIWSFVGTLVLFALGIAFFFFPLWQ